LLGKKLIIASELLKELGLVAKIPKTRSFEMVKVSDSPPFVPLLKVLFDG